MNNTDLIEIKNFLEGDNDELKYIVNIETDKSTNIAKCVIHKPNGEKYIEDYKYKPFLFVKDFKKHGIVLYNNNKELIKIKMQQYGITFKKLNTGKQKRLEDGFCYKVTSSISYQSILDFYNDGGINIYQPKFGNNGKPAVDYKGDKIFVYRHLFYTIKLEEQFFIDRKTRLFKGIDFYSDLHRLVFDIETQGLRHSINRIFAIVVKDNKGFEVVLKVDKIEDDESERNLIVEFFKCIDLIKPAVICGYNSEDFDFDFIISRAKILGLDLSKLKTTLDEKKSIYRNEKATVKIGGASLRYISTIMWGYSIIDIMHAVKKTMAINSEIKEYGLKYISKYEGVAKEDRTYIDGDDNGIYHIWRDNFIYFINPKNNKYIIIPESYQSIAKDLYNAEILRNSNKISIDEYSTIREKILKNNIDFIKWYKEISINEPYSKLISGKEILIQYILDDAYETQKIDDLYNQSSFLLAKLVPTTYARVCTMGTASTWNLILTAWSFNNDLAIPDSDEKENFSGGLSRCFKKGYNRNIVKIDFASLYPMIQLTYDVFPIFDVSNIIKRILMYFTTTRNVYKKMASGDSLGNSELDILELNGFLEIIDKYNNNKLTDDERKLFKILQLPIKILNNSLFGALGSGVSFNWSDNVCAGRITTIGRLELRKTLKWFEKYGCKPLLCVTDGINFSIPTHSTIHVDGEIVEYDKEPMDVNLCWKFNNKTGISALIDKFNDEIKKERDNSYISVDNDGEFISCLNLKKNNYALLVYDKKKNKNKVKLTGGMIKSKVMPEYIEEFIDKALIILLEGRGYEFVEYYNEYCEKIYYNRIPLKKIASKKRVKESVKEYINRGTDKNGRLKAKKAHMELIIMERDKLVKKLFIEHIEIIKTNFDTEIEKLMRDKSVEEFVNTIQVEKLYKYVKDWMPNEPELDSTLYIVNTGYKNNDGDSALIVDVETGEERFASNIINKKDLENDPNMLGYYNVDKYLKSFNNKVEPLFEAFDENIKDKIKTSIKKTRYKDEFGNKKTKSELIKNIFNINDLVLCDCDLNDIDEAITMQKEEIIYWNKTGYNPNKIWDGYKIEDESLRYDIYENALNYLNEKMVETGKNKIKKVDDNRVKGDLILFKNKNKFSIGYYNGVFVEIVREDVNIPNMEMLNYKDHIFEFEHEFKDKYKIDKDIDLFELFKLEPKAELAYNDFCIEMYDEYSDVYE